MYFFEGPFEEVVYDIEKSKLAVKKRKAASDGTLTYMADFMVFTVSKISGIKEHFHYTSTLSRLHPVIFLTPIHNNPQLKT